MKTELQHMGNLISTNSWLRCGAIEKSDYNFPQVVLGVFTEF